MMKKITDKGDAVMENEFTVKWKNGKITINVYNYLAKAKITDIKRFIKLCSEYSTSEDKKQLIKQAIESKTFWIMNFKAHKIVPYAPNTKVQFDKLMIKLTNVITYMENIWGINNEDARFV